MASLSPIIFRPMSLADVTTVHSIEQAAHYHPWTQKLLTEAVAHYHCWLLVEQQQILGYGILKVVADEAEILNIAITPAHQGKGLGKQLLAKLMLEAEQLKAQECFLEVRESNTHAYRLYEQFGFNEVGRRANYYPAPQGYEDALIMVYSLATF